MRHSNHVEKFIFIDRFLLLAAFFFVFFFHEAARGRKVTTVLGFLFPFCCCCCFTLVPIAVMTRKKWDKIWWRVIIVMCFLTAPFRNEKRRNRGKNKVFNARASSSCSLISQSNFRLYHHVRLLTFISHVCCCWRAYVLTFDITSHGKSFYKACV